MAEVKNSFISSKMNKDLDDRLIPSNEYRDALNIEVGKSETNNIGVLQNVLGNKLVADFYELTGINNLQCIGAYADNSTSNIYIFLTDNNNVAYNNAANNFIYVYNSLDNSSTKLVFGPFLNFSTLNPVIGNISAILFVVPCFSK